MSWIIVIRDKSIKKYGQQLLDTVVKIGLEAPKTTSKKAINKATQTTGEFIGNKSLIKM